MGAGYLGQHAQQLLRVEADALDYWTLDVFTDRPFAGNQLAVFSRAAGLDAELMQAIAAELNLSETAFVTSIDRDGFGFDLRIFTPTMELPFAGHPTIGSAIALTSQDLISCDARVTCRSVAGEITLEVERAAGWFASTLVSPQLPRRLQADLTARDAAALLSLPEASIVPPGPRAYSAGVAFMMIQVADRAALDSVRIDLQLWSDLLAATECPHVYVFAVFGEGGSSISARMFAPLMGITEDPATGAAAAALAGLLAEQQRLPDGEVSWTIRQGEKMGRPSLIQLGGDIRSGELSAVRVGGTAILTGQGRLYEVVLENRSTASPKVENAAC